ncbi:putative N-acetylglucosaminyl-phosphatidylinositol de-N-acetylase [Podospora australis]|uniref:N-acetylglucosaminylphosphatidylinositol deacetylase n=1 Tax=Podospora australis TaxID=1536484 RepID=A0AAN6WTF4_9PEZI|nr:putative N-acetylglucosaminyl-phosphatidylinositol de-N-acetylase [Podospora australis]
MDYLNGSLPVWGVVVLVISSLYIYTASVISTRFPALQNKRICLLIAHPDDEAMFFAPTVLALARPEAGNHVKILCLSSGDADGLGETRKKELAKSGMVLGLRSADDVFVVEKPEFRDSITTTWDASKIAALMCSTFAPNLAKSRKADTAPAASIDVLITFDSGGVSSHPNHISLFHGAKKFVAELVAGKPGWKPPVDLYTLTSVPMIRKYSAFLDLPATLASWAFGADKRDKKRPGGLVFVNGPGGHGSFTTAWKAMTTAHKSQMVWFRYGWISLSRYMYMNDLRLENKAS